MTDQHKAALDALDELFRDKNSAFQVAQHLQARYLSEHKETIRAALQRPEPSEGDDLIKNVLIGGNHLASALIGTADPAQYRNAGYYDVLEKHGQPYADMFVAWKAIMNLRDKPALAPQEVDEWQPIETAPRGEEVFVCRHKDKPHVTFEAAIFRESESWEMPQEYDALQNMTTDEPIEDWDDLEWMPLPQPPSNLPGTAQNGE